jgi:hypothetical protein
MKSAAKMKQGTGDVEIAVRKMIASGKAPSLENRYREAKWRIELNELMAENTLVNTSLASSQAIAARSQAIAAYFHKKHKKKRNEKR